MLGCLILAIVSSSVIPLMDEPPAIMQEQISCEMLQEMKCAEPPLRVISFNMLFDRNDRKLPQDYKWPIRRSRVIEYIRYSHPDIIGSQELQENQREDLINELGQLYHLFGGEQAIFYNTERLEFVSGRCSGRITSAFFRDKRSGNHFTVINTYLTFMSAEARLHEAKQLVKVVQSTEGPIIITGDMNSFPMRPNLAIPFYDGDHIIRVIESSGVRDARLSTTRGHFGLISSTNYWTEKSAPFSGEGEPGVILDHIFVSDLVKVRTHAIDPATVDGLYLSDHFPVIADLFICKPIETPAVDASIGAGKP